MSDATADVIIVGGGIAGAATALLLARAGIDALIVERATFPRDKACGEGLLPHGVEMLGELGCADVLPEIEAQPFRGIRYRCQGIVAEGDFADGGIGRGVRRLLLDAAIQRRALAAGARMLHDNVISVRTDGDGVEVTRVGGPALRAKLAVGADGPRSVVRHALELDGGAPARPRYALRAHFRVADPKSGMPDRVEVDVQGGFELYVTPVGPGIVGVAALCERDAFGASGKAHERLRERILKSPAVRDRIAHDASDVLANPIDTALACGPLRVRAKAVHRGRAVLVGDAAGYVDAITGEGMSLGLRTAKACANAVVRVLREHVDVDVAFAQYARERQAMFRDHALLTHGLVAMARHPAIAKRAVGRLAREPALFTRLLAVNDGRRTLTSLGALDLMKLALG